MSFDFLSEHNVCLMLISLSSVSLHRYPLTNHVESTGRLVVVVIGATVVVVPPEVVVPADAVELVTVEVVDNGVVSVTF